jgi:RNA polymerase sigma-70 factor, ECF subfamily
MNFSTKPQLDPDLAAELPPRPPLTLIHGGARSEHAQRPPTRERFRAEVEQTVPALYPRALQLCRNRDQAADLVQDTVERAMRFWKQFTLGSNLKAWLSQILFSVFVTGRRRATRERRALESLTHDPCAWTHRDPAPLMTALPAPLKTALLSIPDAFGKAVLLVDVHGLSYREAALQLGVPVGTVMSRLHRGRRMLREALPDEAA